MLRLDPNPPLDLSALVDMARDVVWDAVVLVAEKEHGRFPCASQLRKGGCPLCKFDSDDAFAGLLGS
jgi:hypothetical protein